jgi:hypothetical protein
MTTVKKGEGIQFTVDQNGQITAVVVPPDLWQRIMAALEDVEDRTLIQSLQLRLSKGPAASGALRWEQVAEEWQ